jgi:hypothetical protein
LRGGISRSEDVRSYFIIVISAPPIHYVIELAETFTHETASIHHLGKESEVLLFKPGIRGFDRNSVS